MHLRCWFARKMSQFTHFCSVKFLAWKSGCVKFLTIPCLGRRSFFLPKCRVSVEETLVRICNWFSPKVEYYISCEFLLVTPPPPSHCVPQLQRLPDLNMSFQCPLSTMSTPPPSSLPFFPSSAHLPPLPTCCWAASMNLCKRIHRLEITFFVFSVWSMINQCID